MTPLNQRWAKTPVGHADDNPQQRQPKTTTGAGWRRPPRTTQAGGALLGGHRQRSDRHVHASLGLAGELHVPIDQRKDRVVPAKADMLARLPLGAALTQDDVAGNHALAARLLDAEAPAFRIAPVARRAAGFLVCHDPLLLRGDPWLGGRGKIFEGFAG